MNAQTSDDQTPIRGRFITFEGGEGAGKSTQIQQLKERLLRLEINVVVTREPGGSPTAEELRAILLSGAAQQLGSTGEAVLFAAARVDHVDRLIRPALNEGRWVLCDRFIDSTRVYQGLAGGTEPEIIRALERIAIDELLPDLTIIIDVPAETGLKRVADRAAKNVAAAPDRFEGDDLDIHRGRRQAFLNIAEKESKRCQVVDGTQKPNDVARDIWDAVVKQFDIQDSGRLAGAKRR